MVRVKPFAALRPSKAQAATLSAPPYDVINSQEAARMASGISLLHITRPEIDFDPILPEHDPAVYDKAVVNFKKWQDEGLLKRDPEERYYIYAQTMGERTQYGIVLCAHIKDYEEGIIKRHELTRRDKEDDRMKHIEIQSANIEPVFFAFKDNSDIASIMEAVVKEEPEYSFTDENSFKHELWVIRDCKVNERLTAIFTDDVDAFYVADGHHRTAAAARVGADRRAKNPAHDDNLEYNWFMAVCFPESQLRILDYNRVVKDLNGYESADFIKALSEDFEVELKSKPRCGRKAKPYSPSRLHEFSMYLDGCWYSLCAKEGTYDDNDPIGVLDVTVLSNRVLDKLLGIKDLRTDRRIDFVGGIRGLDELARRVDSAEMKVAFALYPVSMQQLINIADSGKIMPPKTTWFEPKLRSGLFIHTF